jgi:uncharacterized protein YndB with AHSA1/START domain
VRFRETVEIRRPPPDVFAFLADVANLPRWQSSVKEVRGGGTFGPGGRVTETREFLGRRVRSTLEVTAFEPARELSLRVIDGPVALTIRHLLEASDGGTRLTLEAEGEAGGRARLAVAVAARAAARQAKHDLRRLKQLLETT